MDGCGRVDFAVGAPGAARAGPGHALAPPAGVLAGWFFWTGATAHVEPGYPDCERDGGALPLPSLGGIRHGSGGPGVALPESARGVGYAGGAGVALYRTHLGAQRGLARQPHAGTGRRRNRAAERALADRSPRVAWATLGALALLYTGRTWARNADWRDNLTLGLADVETAPRSARLQIGVRAWRGLRWGRWRCSIPDAPGRATRTGATTSRWDWPTSKPRRGARACRSESARGVGYAGGAGVALYRTHLGAQRGLARQPHAGTGRRRNRAAERAL